MKIRQVGVKLFHLDGRTDRRTARMTKLIVAFRNFANTSKKPPNKIGSISVEIHIGYNQIQIRGATTTPVY